MKRILIRGGQSPFDVFSPTKVILDDTIGTNAGNLIYAFGVLKAIITDEDIEIVPDRCKYEKEFVTQKEADEISEKFDCYMIPLADAFRSSFTKQMQKMTSFINKLKIPCYLVGVGLSAPLGASMEDTYSFDNDVKNLVGAVLKKSSMVGVRGEITSAYLSRLGFAKDVVQTPIGCPSMYIPGRTLKIRDTKISRESKICMNQTYFANKNVMEFMTNITEIFPNYYYIPQMTRELKCMYLGAPYKKENSLIYPTHITHPTYMENHARFFLNAVEWIKFAGDADLSIGPRIHGNIVPTVAGTPSIVIAKDSRMMELVDYHKLPYILENQVDKNTNVWDLIEKMDFKSPEKVQSKNFDHFVDFLNINGIENIYSSDVELESKEIPIYNKLKKIDLYEGIEPITTFDFEQMTERWNEYFPAEEKQRDDFKKISSQYKRLTGEMNSKTRHKLWMLKIAKKFMGK